MSEAWLDSAAPLVAILVPLALALATPLRRLRPIAITLGPYAALPALVTALGAPKTTSVELRWLLLGSRFYVPSEITSGFLLLTATLWLFAGLFARGYLRDDARRATFWSFFLTTMAGNIGVVLAGDVASFYAFYALMTFAAYGLIVHERNETARRAGRVYLVMALGGEVLLLAAFLIIVGTSANLPLEEVPRAVAAAPRSALVIVLLLAGFGVKAGAVPLHMWLPLAHPIAPTPASAVFSGALINAGLLGWLRFLPLGFSAHPTLGTALAVLGLTAALYAVTIGLQQRDPKIVLAYSSISQMGFMTIAVGVGLALPDLAASATAVALFYALHHALAKGSLFLGTAVAKATRCRGWPRALVTAGLLWPALELAGAPLSSGALAKISLKSVVAAAHWQWLTSALPFAALASTLVVLHFFSLARPRRAVADAEMPPPGLWVPWLALLVVDSLFLLMPPVDSAELHLLMRRDKLWSAGWPVLVGALLSAAAWRWRGRRGRDVASVPAGDVLVLGEAAARWLRANLRQITRRTVHLESVKARVLATGTDRVRDTLAGVERAEARLRGFGPVGMLLLLLVTILLGMLLPQLGRPTASTREEARARLLQHQPSCTP